MSLALETLAQEVVNDATSYDTVYGEIGADFIEVHHLKPLSQSAGAYDLDPIEDLRPVCSNCHSMLHRRQPPLSIEDLVDRLRRAKK